MHGGWQGMAGLCIVVQCTVQGFPRARSILGAAAAVAAGAVTRESLARSE